MSIKFRTPYNYDTDLTSFTSGLDCSHDPSRAQQHMKDETDINKLVSTYARTGQIPGQDTPAMTFAIDDIIDFQTAQNALIESRKAFGALPSKIRDRFENDPAQILHFLSDSRNKEEAISLGLLPASPPPIPATVPVSQNAPTVKENPTE